MTSLPVTQGKAKFLFGLKSRLCGFFNGFKNAKMNGLVVARNAGNIFIQALAKVNTSHSTTIGGSFPLIFHVYALRDNSEVRPHIIARHAVNVVNIFRPVSKHQKSRNSMSKIDFAKHSKSGIPLCIQGWAYSLARITRVVFSASAFWRVSWIGILTGFKHIWSSRKPNKLPSIWVILNGRLNQFVNVCHNAASPLLFDNGYTSLRNAHQGA
jgi:hypothetical protein